jgi:hypothetical protein
VGFVRGLGLLLATGFAVGPAYAQSCPQLGIQHSGQLTYPPIAMAAHVTGTVTVLATFAPDGSVVSAQVTEGAEMLKSASRAYVESWRVNHAATSQTCAVAIAFRMDGEPICAYEPSRVTMSDTQHFAVTVRPTGTCDPAFEIDTRLRHRFLFVHWTTKPKFPIGA